jgi:hypothetical protein
MSANQDRIEALLRDGIAAAKAGNKAQAQENLREVVALDENNEKGWLWLAAVVESEEEKRVCLSNVLVINPGNTKAKDELNTLERTAAIANLKSHERTAVNNRALLTLGAVAIVAVLVSLAVLIGVSALQSIPPAPTVASTIASTVASLAGAGTPDGTSIGLSGTETTSVTAITETVAVTASSVPTEEPTGVPGVTVVAVVQSTLPPTWTPQPTPTSLIPPTGTPLAKAPASLPGRLVVISGPILTLEGFLPVWVVKPDGSDLRQVTDELGRGDFAILTPDGKIIYTYLAGGTDARLLRYINQNNTQARILSEAWGNLPALDNQRMATITRDGRIVAFAGKNILQNEQFTGVYVVNLSRFLNFPTTPVPTDVPPTAIPPTRVPTRTRGTPAPTAIPPTDAPPGTATPTITPIPMSASLIRVTQRDAGENNWPAISGDGSQIVFTNDATAIGRDGIDLYIAPVRPDTTPVQLTSDGNAQVESAPAFSPDGKQIAFNVATEANPDRQKNEIVIMNADGSGREVLVPADGTNNIRPRWSPDGKYIAFSSDRTGKMEVFIIELATKTIYQVTETLHPTILTDWGAS